MKRNRNGGMFPHKQTLYEREKKKSEKKRMKIKIQRIKIIAKAMENSMWNVSISPVIMGVILSA